mgnify:CR=1 FL=1
MAGNEKKDRDGPGPKTEGAIPSQIQPESDKVFCPKCGATLDNLFLKTYYHHLVVTIVAACPLCHTAIGAAVK